MPITQVKTPATKVISVPKTISKMAQPVIKFESKHPAVIAITDSGKISGKIVSPSDNLICMLPLATGKVKSDKTVYKAQITPQTASFLVVNLNIKNLFPDNRKKGF